MPSRFSTAAIALVAVVLIFTGWITWRAKSLEQNLDTNTRSMALLNKAAPDFHLSSLDGRTISLADYRGKKKVVVVFWASWNNGSHAVMPPLGSFAKMARTPDADFDIVTISVDDDKKAVESFVRESKLELPVLLDPSQAVTKAFGVRSIPALMLIDTGGKVTFGRVGFNQGTFFELAQQLGVTYRGMEFGAPNGRRRN
jgi:peroxiredoxin